MQFENRQPPEGINVTRVNPLVQFFKLLVAAAIVIVVIVGLLRFFGGAIAARVPFKYELRLMDQLDIDFGSADSTANIVTYLNELSARIEPNLPMRDGYEITVHYDDDAVFNAFATIGGNLLFYRGLLSEMPSENALAMVMAHEMAHVNHRDPITSFGGGIASMIALSMITGEAGFAGRSLSQAGILTNTQFTRRMESAADEAALGALYRTYGHVNGADTLFEVMGDIKTDSKSVPDWLERFAATHPLSNDRVLSVKALAEKNGWPIQGALTPLPDEFIDWLYGN